MYSRVSNGIKVTSGKLAMGNPTSCLLPVSGSPSKPASTGVQILHKVLTVAMLVYMTAAVYATVEIVRDLPIYHWERLEARVPVAFGVAILVLQLLLFLQVVAFKRCVMGKTVEKAYPSNGTHSVLLMQSQVLEVIHCGTFEPFYNGLIPMNVYYRAVGNHVDLTTSLLNRTSTPGDGELVYLHPWCVIDAGVIFSSHLVASGATTMMKVELHRNAVMHPHSSVTNGTVGAGGCMHSMSCVVKRVHIGDGEHWIGSPATRARVAVAGDAPQYSLSDEGPSDSSASGSSGVEVDEVMERSL
jgi:hypothetical protein